MSKPNKNGLGKTTTVKPTRTVIRKELEEEGSLLITEKFASQVRALCRKSPKREWSGVLIYEILKGDVSDIPSLEIKPILIFPLDIGSGAFTSYEDFSNKMLEVFIKFPIIRENIIKGIYSAGHIHSHNIMETFFSHTDMSELDENADKYAMYVSIIVNNVGDVTAKGAFYKTIKRKVKEESFFKVLNRKTKTVVEKKEGYEEESSIMTHFNFNVLIETEKDEYLDFVADTFDKVIEEDAKKKKAALAKSTVHHTPGYRPQGHYATYKDSRIPTTKISPYGRKETYDPYQLDIYEDFGDFVTATVPAEEFSPEELNGFIGFLIGGGVLETGVDYSLHGTDSGSELLAEYNMTKEEAEAAVTLALDIEEVRDRIETFLSDAVDHYLYNNKNLPTDTERRYLYQRLIKVIETFNVPNKTNLMSEALIEMFEDEIYFLTPKV